MAVEESELSAGSAYARRIAVPRTAIMVPAAILLVFACQAALFVTSTYLNRDEGWYLLSGRLAYEGQVPYRDFPYFQMPLVPYVFGLPQAFLAPSIDGGRVIAAAFGLISIGLVTYIATRMGGIVVAGIAAAVLLVSPDFMMASTTARAEAIVVPLMLGAVALALARPRGVVGLAGPPALLLLATAARLTFLPAFFIALAYCWWSERPSRRDAIVGGGALAAISGVLSVPFLMASPGRVLFDIWSAQADRNGQFQPDATPLYDTFAHRVGFFSIPADAFFVVMIPVALLAGYAYIEWQRGWRPTRPGFDGDVLSNHLALIAFSLLLWAPFVGFDHQETRYFVPSLAVLAIVVADVVVRAGRGALGESMRLTPVVFAGLFVAHAVFGMATLPQVLDRRDVRETADVGAYMQEIGGDGSIVTLNPTLALASGMPLPSPLVMGQFSFWGAFSDQRAHDAGIVNVDLLEDAMLDSRTSVVALDDYDLGLIAGFKGEASASSAGDAWPFKLFPSLKGKYVLARRVDNFGQFAGTLYILQRVPAQSTTTS